MRALLLLLAAVLLCSCASPPPPVVDERPIIEETDSSITYLTGVWGIHPDEVIEPGAGAGSFVLRYSSETFIDVDALPPGERVLYDRIVDNVLVQFVPLKDTDRPNKSVAPRARGKAIQGPPAPQKRGYAIHTRLEGHYAYHEGEHILHAEPAYTWTARGTTADDIPEAAVWRIWNDQGRPQNARRVQPPLVPVGVEQSQPMP